MARPADAIAYVLPDRRTLCPDCTAMHYPQLPAHRLGLDIVAAGYAADSLDGLGEVCAHDLDPDDVLSCAHCRARLL